jgi:hypothetical protein
MEILWNTTVALPSHRLGTTITPRWQQEGREMPIAAYSTI